MNNCEHLEQRIEELEDYNGKIEQALVEAMNQRKTVAKISEGPFRHEGKEYYLIKGSSDDSRMVSISQEGFFGGKTTSLEKGDSVVTLGEVIIDVLPEALAPTAKKAEFEPIHWDDIGGLKSQLQRIRSAIELPLHNAGLAEDLGLSPIKGMLLYGPPGCGKTLVAKAVASMIVSEHAPAEAFTYIKGAELLSMYVGATEQRILSIFQACREYTKKHGERAIIFIDEAEALLSRRGSRVSSDVDKTIVPTFLSEMDGFNEHSPIIILSTNIPSVLDPAVLREGRIDLKIEIEPPTPEDALEIFDIHLKKVKCYDDVLDLAEKGVEGLYNSDLGRTPTGAMVETVVQLSAQQALHRITETEDDRRGVTTDDITQALNSIVYKNAETNFITPNGNGITKRQVAAG